MAKGERVAPAVVVIADGKIKSVGAAAVPESSRSAPPLDAAKTPPMLGVTDRGQIAPGKLADVRVLGILRWVSHLTGAPQNP